MSDNNIKKVIIPKASLPDTTAENKYLVRYRIVSEDRNRVSGWSPIFLLDASEPVDLGESNVTYSINNRVISLAWQDNQGRPRYDIFVKFDGQEEYEYHGTATSTSYTLISQGVVSFQFAIQVSSILKVKSPQLEIYESDPISLI